MKKNLFLVIMVLGLLAASNNSQAQLDPNVKILLYANVCPAIEDGPALWTPFVNHVQGVLKGDLNELNGISPNGFHAITAGSWPHLCVDPSTQWEMWLAVPGGDLHGNGISFPFKVVSTGEPVTLGETKVTLTNWDGSLGTSQVLSNYFPEALGVKGNGEEVKSGPSTAPVQEIRYVGRRRAYSANNQNGVDVIRDYVNSIPNFGITCIVEVFRGGVLVARAQLDIPFNPVRSTVQININGSLVRVNGTINQQYRLQATTSLVPSNWQSLGLPVYSGTAVTENSGASMRFYRAFQGPVEANSIGSFRTSGTATPKPKVLDSSNTGGTGPN